jgi:hypothetical protein
MTWRRTFSFEPISSDVRQTCFTQAVIATAETVAVEPGAPMTGRMVIEIGKDRRVIVDAGVDAAALGRVLAVWSGDDPGRSSVRIWIASGHTDMRKGMNGLALLVQEGLGR